MKEKILLSNETLMNDKNYKIMMFCKKIYIYTSIVFIKVLICLFIIITSIILDLNIVNKVFYIIMGILGIIDTFKVKETKSSRLKNIKYDFYENYFLVNNGEMILEIQYREVDTIIEKKNYYFLNVKKVPVIIDKNSFTLGTNQEFKKIMKKATKFKFYKTKTKNKNIL